MSAEATGTVKWFDLNKGYGFVVLDDDPEHDVMLHVNVVQAFGQSSVTPGARLRLTVEQGRRGLQATTIHEIEALPDVVPGRLQDLTSLSESDIAEIEIEPARVKWYDIAKGYGFANAFRASEDIFLHADVLRRGGLAGLQAGEAIALRAADGSRGLIAVEVLPWEAAKS